MDAIADMAQKTLDKTLVSGVFAVTPKGIFKQHLLEDSENA